MKKEEYLELVKSLTPKENKLANMVNAFLVGGLLGFIGDGLKMLLVAIFNMTFSEAISWVLLIYIVGASICTALGFFDSLVGKFKCGLIVPITGFAHSITSAALDYRKDGLITGLGANIFKLSGCVLLYGIVAAFIMAVLKVIFYV